MYEELTSRLLSLSEIDAIQQEPGICRITMECIGAIQEIAIEAADAVEELNLIAESNRRNAKAWADTAEKAAEQIPRWIPVTEQLPEDSKNVLAAFDDVVLVAFYSNNEWSETATYSVFFPTHWMPLPEPPKEET